MESWKEELYHHGIQGQKWGVRRYQNSDGSLTAAGKKHVSQKANIKSSNDSAASSGGGGGGGGAEEITDHEYEILDEEINGILDRNGSYELPDKNDSEWDAELGEMGFDTQNMSKEKRDALYDQAKAYYDERKGKKSEPQKKRTEADKQSSKEAIGKAIAERKKRMSDMSRAEKELTQQQAARHSDSSKAYVGTLGMKWKISN